MSGASTRSRFSPAHYNSAVSLFGPQEPLGGFPAREPSRQFLSRPCKGHLFLTAFLMVLHRQREFPQPQQTLRPQAFAAFARCFDNQSRIDPYRSTRFSGSFTLLCCSTASAVSITGFRVIFRISRRPLTAASSSSRNVRPRGLILRV